MITISYADKMHDMSNEDKEALSLSAERWGKRARLTKDEVIALAQTKDAGRAAAAQLEQPGCTDIGTLTTIKDAGLEARNTLVECNMALVLRIARGWTGRGVPFEDLVQEGAIGLMRAADLFDWQRGTEFSTFAGLRVVQACQRAIENQANAIRIPVHTRSTGMCKPEVARAKQILSGNKTVLKGQNGNNGRETELFDRIKSEDDTAEQAITAARTSEIRAALAALPERECQIMTMICFEDMDMADIGRRLGITRERVRQLKNQAVARMRAAFEGVSCDY